MCHKSFFISCAVRQIIINRTSQKFCECYFCPGGLFSDSCFFILFQPPEDAPAAPAVVPRSSALLPETGTETLPFPPPGSVSSFAPGDGRCGLWDPFPGAEPGSVAVPAPLTSPRERSERTELSRQRRPKTLLPPVLQPRAPPGVPALLLERTCWTSPGLCDRSTVTNSDTLNLFWFPAKQAANCFCVEVPVSCLYATHSCLLSMVL